MTQQIRIGGIDVHIDGNGPETIVLVHGWPDTYRLWDDQVLALQSKYRCVRFSLPGFEESRTRKAYSLDEVIDVFKMVVAEICQGKQVILMLHDWGCVFGYQFYIRNPQMVSAIIGVDVGDPTSFRHFAALHE